MVLCRFVWKVRQVGFQRAQHQPGEARQVPRSFTAPQDCAGTVQPGTNSNVRGWLWGATTVIEMSRGFPSMTALLGLLAIAGYQHRDKLAELLRNAQAKSGAPGAGGSPGDRGAQGGLDGVLGKLGGLLGGTSAGGLLGGGLRDLVENLKSNGQGEVADSWVRTGPNKPISPQELEAAISPEVWASLSEQTGLSRQELLSRLSRELPEAVDKYTPDGRLPAAA
jgi:uncharacterized protein YidB (DUF937 family)